MRCTRLVVTSSLLLGAVAATPAHAAGDCRYTGDKGAFIMCIYRELQDVEDAALADVAALQGDVVTLQSQLTAAEAAIATLDAALTDAEALIDAQGAAIADGAADVADLAAVIDAIYADYLTAADAAGFANAGDLSALDLRVSFVEGDYVSLAAASAFALDADHDALDARVAAIEADYLIGADLGPYALDADVDALDADVDALDARVSAIEADYVVAGDLSAYALLSDLTSLQSVVDEIASTYLATRVFVTRDTFAITDFVTPAGADALCQAVADGEGLGGTWMAWISSSSDAVTDRFTHSAYNYELLDGTVIANGWDDLTDASLDAGITVDEAGVAYTTTPFVWTGTNGSGQGLSTIYTCSDWTSTANSGKVGEVGASDVWWTTRGNASCGGSRPLYCFEQ